MSKKRHISRFLIFLAENIRFIWFHFLFCSLFSFFTSCQAGLWFQQLGPTLVTLFYQFLCVRPFRIVSFSFLKLVAIHLFTSVCFFLFRIRSSNVLGNLVLLYKLTVVSSDKFPILLWLSFSESSDDFRKFSFCARSCCTRPWRWRSSLVVESSPVLGLVPVFGVVTAELKLELMPLSGDTRPFITGLDAGVCKTNDTDALKTRRSKPLSISDLYKLVLTKYQFFSQSLY